MNNDTPQPTPETDEQKILCTCQGYPCEMVPVLFTRKLERQRNTMADALRLMVATFSKCSSPAQGGSDPFTWIYQKEFEVARDALALVDPQPIPEFFCTPPKRFDHEPVTPEPPPAVMAALTPDCNHAVVGLAVHPTKPPRFVYSLPALVEREAFTNPSCPDPYQAVWDMVAAITSAHGDAAPVFLDDAAAREARQKTVITNFGRKIIVP